MHWISTNYQWVVAVVAMPIILLLLKRWADSPKKTAGVAPTQAVLSAEASSVSNSPVAGGSGNTQNVNAPVFNVNIGQSAPAPPQPEPVRAQREEPRSQIIATGTRVIRVNQTDQTEWSDRGPYFNQDAVVIQFTNEAAASHRNSQPIVRASLVYSDGHNRELLRITGGWVNQATDLAPFRLEESHNLLVGVLLGDQIVAMEHTRTPSAGGGEYCHMTQRPLRGFQQGSVRVRLTDIHSHTLLYEGYFEISVNPLRIAPR